MSLLNVFKKEKRKKPTLEQDKKNPESLKYSARETGFGSLLLRVLEKPFLSEKSNRLNSLNQYVFMVNLKANKNNVKEAIEKKFNVNVLKVNIIRSHGKSKKFKNIKTNRSDFKKAIITLKNGQKIETI